MNFSVNVFPSIHFRTCLECNTNHKSKSIINKIYLYRDERWTLNIEHCLLGYFLFLYFPFCFAFFVIRGFFSVPFSSDIPAIISSCIFNPLHNSNRYLLKSKWSIMIYLRFLKSNKYIYKCGRSLHSTAQHKSQAYTKYDLKLDLAQRTSDKWANVDFCGFCLVFSFLFFYPMLSGTTNNCWVHQKKKKRIGRFTRTE